MSSHLPHLPFFKGGYLTARFASRVRGRTPISRECRADAPARSQPPPFEKGGDRGGISAASPRISLPHRKSVPEWARIRVGGHCPPLRGIAAVMGAAQRRGRPRVRVGVSGGEVARTPSIVDRKGSGRRGRPVSSIGRGSGRRGRPVSSIGRGQDSADAQYRRPGADRDRADAQSGRLTRLKTARMRRLHRRGSSDRRSNRRRRPTASMGPRLHRRGSPVPGCRRPGARRTPSFNGATSP